MVERGSVQHGARLDEELAEGSELALRGGGMTEREDLQPELPGGDETTDVRVPPGSEAPNGPDPDAVHDRSELARWLQPSRFPADALALVRSAREDGAPDAVLAELAALPADVHYETVGEVWRALGGEVEVRGGDAEVAADTDLGTAVTPAVTEVAAEVAPDPVAVVEPLTDEAVVEGGLLAEGPRSADPEPVVVEEVVVEEVVVTEEVILTDEEPGGSSVEDAVVGPASSGAASGTTRPPAGEPGWSERHEEQASLLAHVAGLTVAVVDLALVPVRIGVSIVGRALRAARPDRH